MHAILESPDSNDNLLKASISMMTHQLDVVYHALGNLSQRLPMGPSALYDSLPSQSDLSHKLQKLMKDWEQHEHLPHSPRLPQTGPLSFGSLGWNASMEQDATASVPAWSYSSPFGLIPSDWASMVHMPSREQVSDEVHRHLHAFVEQMHSMPARLSQTALPTSLAAWEAPASELFHCVEEKLGEMSEQGRAGASHLVQRANQAVHDVEDGILSRRINLNVLWDLVELAALAEKGARVFGGTPEELLEAADRLRAMTLVSRAADFGGSLQDLAALKAMTSELVSRFVTAAVTGTRQQFGEGALGRYAADLVIPQPVQAEVTLLKSVAVLYVMDETQHLANQQRQRERIFRVTDYLWRGGSGALDPMFSSWFDAAASDREALRVVIDQVASLTESRLERLDKHASGMSAAWA